MKTKSALFLLLLTNFLSAQTRVDKMTFIDSTGIEVEQGKHKYYRVVEDYYAQTPLHQFSQYYANDSLYMKGSTSVVDRLNKQGSITYYYKNGKRESITNFKDDKPDGKFFSWYVNGNKKYTGEYIPNKDKAMAPIYKVSEFWDGNGDQKVIDGNGVYESTDNAITEKGTYKEGMKSGTWTVTDSRKSRSYVEEYKNGYLDRGYSIDEKGVKRQYTVLEKKPAPKKGMEDFYKYLASHFHHSRQAMEDKVEGRILLLFTVNEEGAITDIKIIKGLGYGLDEEAIRILTNYGNWAPGEQRGIPARRQFTLPLQILLPPEEKFTNSMPDR